MNDFDLDPLKLKYLMTDNCHTMRSEKSGLIARFSEVCPNMIDIDGCGVHRMNILHKDKKEKEKMAIKRETTKQLKQQGPAFSSFRSQLRSL